MGVGWCLFHKQETSPSRYKMKIFVILTVFVAATYSQIQFGVSSLSSLSSSSSKASSDEPSQSAVSGDEDGVNTRFFGLFKPKPKPKPVWRPKPQQQSYRPTNNCGRRRRQAVEVEEEEASPNSRFFFKPKPKPKPVWVGCTCGKRKRQADEEEGASANPRFFGLFKPKPKPRPVSRPHCGSCCYAGSSSNHHQSSSSQHHQSSKPVQSNSNHYSSSGGGCRCSTNHLIFKDEWGKTHGDCQSADNTGRKWCYTTGWDSGCSDLVKSKRYSSNPWSYDACGGGGSIPNSFIRSGN